MAEELNQLKTLETAFASGDPIYREGRPDAKRDKPRTLQRTESARRPNATTAPLHFTAVTMYWKTNTFTAGQGTAPTLPRSSRVVEKFNSPKTPETTVPIGVPIDRVGRPAAVGKRREARRGNVRRATEFTRHVRHNRARVPQPTCR